MHHLESSNAKEITLQDVIDHQCGLFQMSPEEEYTDADVGRWQCWDEVGLPNGIVNSKEEAIARSKCYVWTYLDLQPLETDKLPCMTTQEQLDYVWNELGKMITLVTWLPRKTKADKILLVRTSTGWKPNPSHSEIQHAYNYVRHEPIIHKMKLGEDKFE